MIDLFLKLGFLEIRFLDIIDILLVALLIYQAYKLIKGSFVINIFLGIALVFIARWIVKLLDMELTGFILGNFTEVGMIALLIVFQPEIRKFLLVLGKESRFTEHNWIKEIFLKKKDKKPTRIPMINEIIPALKNMKSRKIGAIIVFPGSSRMQLIANTGVQLNADISGKLIESIFEKNSPLHDGAMIIAENKIIAAGCVLPVSENPELPSRIGMRHKAAVGITEQSDGISITVSEERGTISYARNGRLIQDLTLKEVESILQEFLSKYLSTKS